jgi:hypothetical protein
MYGRMASASPHHPFIAARRPWWQPLVSLIATLYGIVVQGWGMQAVVLLFWWETFLIVGAALVRVLFALDGKPVMATLGVKLVTLVFGAAMGFTAISLAVAFSIAGLSQAAASDGSLADVTVQSNLLLASYVIGLVVHYFGNGRYRTASAVGEMMQSLLHLLVLLVLMMPITMHLLPEYPHLDRARYVALTVVVVKFLGDTLFSRVDVSRLRD